MKIKREHLLAFLSVASLLLITAGVTFAFFSYVGSGSVDNTITSDSITFLYDEVDKQGNGISIEDALPMSDTDGKGQTNGFNFKILSNTTNTIAIPYEITLRKRSTGNDLDNIVKVYLAKTVNNTTLVQDEQQVALATYSSLPDVTHNGHTEKLLYEGRVPVSTSNYNQGYRLKLWISDSTDLGSVTKYYCGTTEITEAEYNDTEYLCASGEKNTQQVYPYNDKEFSITVNVYANGKALHNGTLYDATEIAYYNSSSTLCGSNRTVQCALDELSGLLD